MTIIRRRVTIVMIRWFIDSACDCWLWCKDGFYSFSSPLFCFAFFTPKLLSPSPWSCST